MRGSELYDLHHHKAVQAAGSEYALRWARLPLWYRALATVLSWWHLSHLRAAYREHVYWRFMRALRDAERNAGLDGWGQ